MELRDKKILITGGHGFLGTHVIEEFLRNGVSSEQIFSPSSSELDLRVWENCQKAVQNQDIVIHLAAKVGGIGLNQEKPGELFYDNLLMGIQLMEAARQAGVKKFVGLGSICAYPKFTPIPFHEEDLWNGYPEETNAPYGLAKKMLLVQAQAYRKQYGFNAIFLMPVNMYGPGDNFNPSSSHVIPALIKKIADAQITNATSIDVWGTGQVTREFIYVEDAARGIVIATTSYDKPEPINLGAGFEISIHDLIATLCRLMDFHGEIRWDKTKPDGQPRRRLDITRAEQEFGFRAQTNFEDGLRKTIDWYLKHQSQTN